MRLVAAAAALAWPAVAFAQGTDDITQSENWPCDTCHPANAAEGGEMAHDVTLKGHDRLGKGRATCLMCHESDAHPERLLALDGKSGPIEKKESVVATCERCHFRQVEEWNARVHGKAQKCTKCHGPHAPGVIHISLAPFGPDDVALGVGKQKPKRKPFRALPPVVGGPARRVPPGATFVAVGGVAVFVALGLVAFGAIVRRKGGAP